MLAAYHGHADLVKVLIQHGADPNRLNDRGQSPLAGAVFKKEDAVIQVSSDRHLHTLHRSKDESPESHNANHIVMKGVAGRWRRS
jgi:hypothetical protein